MVCVKRGSLLNAQTLCICNVNALNVLNCAASCLWRTGCVRPTQASFRFALIFLLYRHGVVRVEDCEQDLYAAVDLVADKLKRKLVKVR